MIHNRGEAELPLFRLTWKVHEPGLEGVMNLYSVCTVKDGSRGCPSCPRGISLIPSPSFIPVFSANSSSPSNRPWPALGRARGCKNVLLGPNVGVPSQHPQCCRFRELLQSPRGLIRRMSYQKWPKPQGGRGQWGIVGACLWQAVSHGNLHPTFGHRHTPRCIRTSRWLQTLPGYSRHSHGMRIALCGARAQWCER